MAEGKLPDDVEFRQMEGFDGYAFGADGSVWSCKKCNRIKVTGWRPMRLTLDRSMGYLVVNLTFPGSRQKRMFVHRLIARAFHGPSPGKSECRHMDGNPLNNSPKNLAWGTSQENSDDRKRHGTEPLGDRHHGAKLNQQAVREMRLLRQTGATYSSIARQFGVGDMTAWNAINRKTWAHVA